MNTGPLQARWPRRDLLGEKGHGLARPDSRPTLASRFGLQRNLEIAFSRHLGPIGDAGQDVGLFQPRILLEDVLRRPSARQEVQDQGNPNTMSPNTRLPEANVWIDGDSR